MHVSIGSPLAKDNSHTATQCAAERLILAFVRTAQPDARSIASILMTGVFFWGHDRQVPNAEFGNTLDEPHFEAIEKPNGTMVLRDQDDAKSLRVAWLEILHFLTFAIKSIQQNN
jgi:hypothetical protein